jgi:hypothetical protein
MSRAIFSLHLHSNYPVAVNGQKGAIFNGAHVLKYLPVMMGTGPADTTCDARYRLLAWQGRSFTAGSNTRQLFSASHS